MRPNADLEVAGKTVRVGIPGFYTEGVGDADDEHLVGLVDGRVGVRPGELQLALDLHLRLQGELVEVGKALAGADHQRDAANHVMRLQIQPGVGVTQVHHSLGEDACVGHLLEATDENLAARPARFIRKHRAEHERQMPLRRIGSVGQDLVEIRRHLQEPVDRRRILVGGVKLNPVEAQLQLRLEEPGGDIGEKANRTLCADHRPRLTLEAAEQDQAPEHPRQHTRLARRFQPAKAVGRMLPILDHKRKVSRSRRVVTTIR